MADINFNGAKNYGLGKTYASSDEAFRDSNYATGLWRCETPTRYAWRYFKHYAEVVVIGGIALWVLYLALGLFLK